MIVDNDNTIYSITLVVIMIASQLVMVATELKMVFSLDWMYPLTVVYHWTIDTPQTSELFDVGDDEIIRYYLVKNIFSFSIDKQ
jgi:hypothetical protein